ncbi:asparagine synthase (glutamine-hydrolyzing) [Alteromonas sp. McT4-15]|uniref:asparagine synthase (glutamine-hydrolyzing) n=1 Tax=Alteromonas sp. McT4-15 TaxID=2881256 RepID=UPI001CF7F95F|nr:asparagine synthase (glutamine-hydrolyzing) [Alteromonas sp. McT4-15]MCB4436299.1 asparagine synthase (glutamine-hydrolyzing) [Alteromonas sp. McT4-15]
MCGILGTLNFTNTVDEQRLASMRDTMPYRGPDSNGIWISNNLHCGLAHLRLSILDPTPAGHQPRVEENGRFVISYNGEVYNYIEIRAELQKKGYTFETGTDTEVILSAYIEWGEDCLNRFNGMFAIAIYDNETETLFLARDRLGIKPVYYYQDEHELIFASETKAILKGLSALPDLNVELIDDYMSFGYIPGEKTLHKGINRLMPGHYAIVKGREMKITQWWDLTFNNDEDKGFDYYLNESKRLLESAIDLRLRSDVPLGIFLSGGIDSSAVVGLLADKVKEPLKTFSIAYDFGKNFDETQYARMVADKFGTDHHELKITPQQFADFIPEYIHLMDEPVTEAAAISLFFVSKLAKEKVTVALSGEGSDEIFAGYDLYQYMNVLEKYRGVVGQKGTEIFAGMANKVLGKSHKVSKYLNMATQPIEKRYKGMSTYPDAQKEALYRPDFKVELEKAKTETGHGAFSAKLFDKTKGNDQLSKMLYFDTKTWLVDDLLIKADRMSMATSVELRVPFLDYRLVEFAASIPSKHKINKGEGKYPLKKMMEGILPNDIIYRKKMGFPTPLKLMFQNELREYATNLLLAEDTRVHKFFKKERIAQLIEEHNADKYDHHKTLWQLVVLEEWLRKNS